MTGMVPLPCCLNIRGNFCRIKLLVVLVKSHGGNHIHLRSFEKWMKVDESSKKSLLDNHEDPERSPKENSIFSNIDSWRNQRLELDTNRAEDLELLL